MKKTTIGTLLLFLAAISLYGQKSSTYNENELLIRFHADATDKAIEELKQKLSAEETGYNPLFDFHLWQLEDPNALEVLKSIIDAAGDSRGKAVVDEIGLNYQLNTIPTNVDDLLQQINLPTYTPIPYCKKYPGTLSTNSGSQTVKIAVIDSGVEQDAHQDIFRDYISDTYNFINESDNIDDDHGHGTSVTGIITASLQAAENQSVEVLSYKILDHTGSGDLFDAIEAIARAKEQGAQILNLSWGYRPIPNDTSVPILLEALKEISKNTLIITAAGNAGAAITYNSYLPAAFENIPNMLTIGASNCSGRLASFSNYGSNFVDLLAPGESILCPDLNGFWALKNGTSFAVPIVTSLAALYASQLEDWNAAKVSCQISQSVKKLPGSEDIVNYGGTLDASGNTRPNKCSNPSPYGLPNYGKIGQDESSTSNSIQVYPNPFQNQIRFRLNTEEEGSGSYRLFDATGKIVLANSFDYLAGSQEQRIPVSGNSLAAGVYYLQVQTTTLTEQIKLVHLR